MEDDSVFFFCFVVVVVVVVVVDVFCCFIRSRQLFFFYLIKIANRNPTYFYNQKTILSHNYSVIDTTFLPERARGLEAYRKCQSPDTLAFNNSSRSALSRSIISGSSLGAF